MLCFKFLDCEVVILIRARIGPLTGVELGTGMLSTAISGVELPVGLYFVAPEG